MNRNNPQSLGRRALDTARNVGQKVATGTALAMVAVGSAMAATDPTGEIVGEVNKGKAAGIAVAVAFVVAVWAITGIHMARRKG